jgi:ribonuclease HI
MPPPSAYHISYADGANHWTKNLASATWTLYCPSHELLHSSDICLGFATNNQSEYTTIIGLLADANHHRIRHLSILLESQLVVLQLNNVYHVCDPCLFRKYLQVRLLSRHFYFITFTHIPRQFNQITDNLANIVLDWHISHQNTFTHINHQNSVIAYRLNTINNIKKFSCTCEHQKDPKMYIHIYIYIYIYQSNVPSKCLHKNRVHLVQNQ